MGTMDCRCRTILILTILYARLLLIDMFITLVLGQLICIVEAIQLHLAFRSIHTPDLTFV